VCLCSPCRFRLCVDLDRGVCDCDCWVMVLDLIRKRWLVCACDVAVFCVIFLSSLLLCVAGIYRDSFGCLGFVEDARNYVAWGGE